MEIVEQESISLEFLKIWSASLQL